MANHFTYIWYERRDSNSHASRHWYLKPACLPIPPLSHFENFLTESLITTRYWGERRGLNPRRPESQSGTLPTELRPPLFQARILPSFEQNIKHFINSILILKNTAPVSTPCLFKPHVWKQ